MKEQGFTLIELLAVIVILAIIALIATPIVLNIINESKENSRLRSAEMYLDAVEQSIALEKMNNTTFNPNSCTITSGNLNCDGTEVEVKVNGEVPETGTITFENGEIKDVTLTYSNDKTVVKNEEGKLEYGEVLVAGLYNENGKLIKSWKSLIDEEIVEVNDGKMRFKDTTIKRKLVIDSSITKIRTFTGSKLTSVIISNSVTSFETGQFAYSSLEEITIPDSITVFPSGSFAGCTSLKTINYTGTSEQWEKIEVVASGNNLLENISINFNYIVK